MAGNDRKKQLDSEVLAVAVAAGESIINAAKLANMSERTARRRAADPEFRQRVEELRAAITDQALGRLTKDMTKAADAFSALLADPAPQVRLAAAKAILDYRSRLRADGELVAKVNELETLVRELMSDEEPAKSNRQVEGCSTSHDRQETESEEDNPLGGSDVENSL